MFFEENNISYQSLLNSILETYKNIGLKYISLKAFGSWMSLTDKIEYICSILDYPIIFLHHLEGGAVLLLSSDDFIDGLKDQKGVISEKQTASCKISDTFDAAGFQDLILKQVFSVFNPSKN